MLVSQLIFTRANLHKSIHFSGSAQTPRTETEDGFEMNIGTNHFGHFLLTNLLLDLMKKSAPSRVVTVSSDAYLWASKGIRFDDIHLKRDFAGHFAYGQSKLANILFTNELSKRLKGNVNFTLWHLSGPYIMLEPPHLLVWR